MIFYSFLKTIYEKKYTTPFIFVGKPERLFLLWHKSVYAKQAT